MTVYELIRILEGSPGRDQEVKIHKASENGDGIEIEYITIISCGEVWIEGIIE